MYFDFDEYRPDTPRVPTAISIREGVLLSLVAHAAALLFILFAPSQWFQASPDEAVAAKPEEEMKYVRILPLVDRSALAKPEAEPSDIDRRSQTIERPPAPENPTPFSRGNTPEEIQGAPEVSAAGPDSPAPPGPDAVGPPSLSERSAGVLAEPMRAPARPGGGNLGQALRNLQRYLQDQNFDNPQGGAGESSADIQFDSKGIDFSPWLRRFTNQIRRNWLIPQVAELARGHVVITFAVLRNGTLIELRVAQPAMIDALTTSAMTALKLSNPTSALPLEYPDDRVLFTVTFHYNEGYRDSQ